MLDDDDDDVFEETKTENVTCICALKLNVIASTKKL
jgi:hypothetical protein